MTRRGLNTTRQKGNVVNLGSRIWLYLTWLVLGIGMVFRLICSLLGFLAFPSPSAPLSLPYP